MSVTQEEFERMQHNVKSKGELLAKPVLAVVQARGSTEERDRGMNKNEERYDKHLRGELRAGRIVGYKFESMKLRLADSTFFTPDFLVIDCDGFIELHDAKAKWKGEKGPHIEDDAAVKLKVVAEQYPWFRVKAVWEDNGVWQVRDY